MEEFNNFEEPILDVPSQQDISLPAGSQQEQINNQTNNSSLVPELERVLAEDAAKLQNLVQSGILTPQQGQYYMSRLAEKSFEINRLKQDSEQAAPDVNIMRAIEEFNKEKPDFFNSEGRYEVLDYLKNSNAVVDKDEINLISQMVEKLENSAIKRYLKQQAHEKALNDENEAAKRKLTANAQNTSSYGNKNKVFTREQIGRMSGAEFTRNEPLIMEQLRKGLIH